MDSPELLYKRESEEVYISVDFTRWLASGEGLASIVSITAEADSDLTISGQSIVGTKAQAKFSGGTSRLEPYCITTIVTTTGGPSTQTYVAETGLVVLPDC